MPLDETSFRTKVLRGFLWLSVGTFMGQLISWVATILVIRILLPSDYGLMAMAFTFIALLTTISELGIGASIIQAEQIKDEEIRQIFGVVVISIFLGWILCYIAAPIIALFYNEQRLVPIIRIMSINFFLIGLYVVPESLFVREMDFKTKAKIDISATVGSSLFTLFLAFKGMGVWALILGLIALHATKAVSFNVARSSWFKPVFNYKGSGRLVRFGVTVTGDRLFYYLYTQLDKIIAGKFLGDNLLGIYAVALNLASIPMEKVLPIITHVSFASYSRIQDDINRIRRNLLRTIHMISFASFPIFLGMAGVAPEAIPLILGSKWESIVLPFQLLSLVLPLKALSNVLPPAIFATGKPKVNLINMAIACVIMAIALLIGVNAGLLGICIAWIFAYPIIFLITSIRCLRVLGIPFRDFFSEIKFPLFASIFMLISIILLKKITVSLQSFSCLIVLIIFGVAFYSGLILVFARDEYLNLKTFLQR